MLTLSEERFETDWMLMAAFLAYHEIKAKAAVDKLDHGSVVWELEFGDDDEGDDLYEKVGALVESFMEGKTTVEPQRFHRVLGIVRGEVYDLTRFTNKKRPRTRHSENAA